MVRLSPSDSIIRRGALGDAKRAHCRVDRREVDVPLPFDLEVQNGGDVLYVLGRTAFTWDQLQIAVPTASLVVSVEDEVSVQLLLLAVAR